jgi:hypothetical protein
LPGTTDGIGSMASFDRPVSSISLNDSHILISDFGGRLRLIKYIPTKKVEETKISTAHPETTSNLIGQTTPSNSPLYPNDLPQASIYFSRLKTINGIAVTVLVGLGFTETYWLITLLISESKKFKSAMFQIASTATILHSMNLAFYYMVLDYQISPYLMGSQQLGAWALLCGVMGNLINILIYWFITLRLYMFMRVITHLTAS